MSLFMDIGQGAGLSGASGVRPFLPALLAGALAMGDVGLDFDGTDFSFLEQWWFLAVVLAVVLTLELVQRRGPVARPASALLAVSAVLGAFMAAGSLADHGYTTIPGIIVGALCA